MRTTRSINICLTFDTLKALDNLAQCNHLSRSAQITQLVWNTAKEMNIYDDNKGEENINRTNDC